MLACRREREALGAALGEDAIGRGLWKAISPLQGPFKIELSREQSWRGQATAGGAPRLTAVTLLSAAATAK
jgi:hypothetical protein